jgi:RNA polymerase sigma factor (sigma-70 family)
LSSYSHMSNQSDLDYINKIVDGDTSAFAILIDRYKDLVFTLAYKMLKNREEAEEIAQDTFIKIYKSVGKFKGDSKFSTWVYKVTYNTCLDYLKKMKRGINITYIEDFDLQQLKTIDKISNAIDENEKNQLIHDCLNLLPSEEAFLLTLFYFEQQSTEEIAKVMDTNANNIKIKLYRTRKKMALLLRQKMEPGIIAYYEKDRR